MSLTVRGHGNSIATGTQAYSAVSACDGWLLLRLFFDITSCPPEIMVQFEIRKNLEGRLSRNSDSYYSTVSFSANERTNVHYYRSDAMNKVLSMFRMSTVTQLGAHQSVI